MFICLLSGGIDSTVALAKACETYEAETPFALLIHYGQRHSIELQYARRIARYYSALVVVQEMAMPMTMLTDKNMPLPDKSYSEIVGKSPTYAPFRNGLMLATAASIAESALRDDGQTVKIVYGAHAEDAAGGAYPDCTPDFFEAMHKAIAISSNGRVELHAPLLDMTKAEVIKEGARLGVPFADTWSCYRGEGMQCGTCPTCRARRDGFKAAGVPDPTEYACDAAVHNEKD